MPSPKCRARWSGRRLTSYLLVLTALALTLSGVMLYLKPSGRVAHTLGWRLLGLSKDDWEGLHTSFSVLFVGAAGWHIWLNYRALWAYFKGFLARTWRAKAELLLAVGLTLFTWYGTLAEWPPLRWLSEWKAQAKAHWQQIERERVSIPSVEELRIVPQDDEPHGARGQQGGMGRLSLAEFCRERNIDLAAARALLSERGLSVEGKDRVREVAERAGLHPRELEALLEGR